MKYIFIIFGFFPLYLLIKLWVIILILICSIVSFIWNFSFKKAIRCFKKGWELVIEGSTFNPILAWSYFLKGIDDYTDCG